MVHGILHTKKHPSVHIKHGSFSFLIFFLFLISSGFHQDGLPVSQDPVVLTTNLDANGVELEIKLTKGYAFLNPLFAFWYEDTLGNFVQTFYVARSVGTGYFQYGILVDEEWKPAALRKPATLPVWAHRRGTLADDSLYMPTPENPVPDAVTGATPKTNFILKTKTNDKELRFINLFMEINQSYDWNDYYTLDIHPQDHDYKDNSQPAIVYSVLIDLKNKNKTYKMRPIGHSHIAGRDGLIYRDMENITTALSIVREVQVTVK
jgi:hypothetical protein